MRKTKPVIALTGGGSGGHVIPLASFYKYMQDSQTQYKFMWIGEEGGLEDNIAEQYNIEFHDIAAGKIRRYFDIKNFYEPLKNLTGLFQGIYYILKYKIDIVFSKGGYVSLPLCIAAKILGKKIYIHESDIKQGLANKVIGIFATKIFSTFTPAPSDKHFNKIITTGQILNPELLQGLSSDQIGINARLKVLVIAGSQGSTIIFENLIKVIPQLPEIDFEIILGDKNQHFRKSLDVFGNVKVYDFVDQKTLGIIYKTTDIAITRASATTLWELYYFGIHSIIIPITNAGDHQIHNAEYFKENFESNVLDENSILSLEMYKKLRQFKDLRKRGLNLDGFLDALRKIEDEMEN